MHLKIYFLFWATPIDDVDVGNQIRRCGESNAVPCGCSCRCSGDCILQQWKGIVLHLDVLYYNQNKKSVLFKFPVDSKLRRA